MENIEIICDNPKRIPTKGTEDAAGYDFIYTDEDVTIEPNTTKMLDLHLKLALNKGMVLFLKTRSSFAIKGINVVGGVIDCDYRGQIKAVLANNSNDNFIVKSGMKICQGVFLNYLNVNFEQVEKFSVPSERGEKGFGSTGLYKY